MVDKGKNKKNGTFTATHFVLAVFWEAFGRLLGKYMSIADDKSGGWVLANLVAYYWLSCMAFAFKSIVHSHHPYIESLLTL